MKARPLIFSRPMIRALLEGRKTMTRRLLRKGVVVGPAPFDHEVNRSRASMLHAHPYLDAYCSEAKTSANPRGMSDRWCWWTRDDRQCLPTFRVGYAPGDLLYVRETHYRYGRWIKDGKTKTGRQRWRFRAHAHHKVPRDCVLFAADEPPKVPAKRTDVGYHKRPSIYMPRWASRLTLEVRGIKIERLQEIGEADIAAEGLHELRMINMTARDCFRTLWTTLHGAESWNANPWVVAVTFAVHALNVDELLARRVG